MTPTLSTPGVRLLESPAPDLFMLDVAEFFHEVEFDVEGWRDASGWVRREGAGPGSLTTDGLEYRVLDGEWLEANEPRLCDAYELFAPVASELLGRQVLPSADRRSRINVNVLEGTGAKYELHTDSQPFTAILFCTTHGFGKGGELLVQNPSRDPKQRAHNRDRGDYSGGATWFVRPEVGRMILFDGAHYPHAARPLTEPGLRVTIPMVFVDPAAGEVRPEGTDDHLYPSS